MENRTEKKEKTMLHARTIKIKKGVREREKRLGKEREKLEKSVGEGKPQKH